MRTRGRERGRSGPEAPAPSRALTPGDWVLVAALFAAAFLPILLTANDYGATYDEPHYVSAGGRYAEWWSLALHSPAQALNREAIESVWSLNHEHPPLQKVASGLSYLWFHDVLPGTASMRLPSALWFALAVCALYLFTRGLWGRGGALFSALAFATMPRVVADAHFTALDMPVAAWFFITAALAAKALRDDSWPWTILTGVAFGLALSSKVNALFLPVLLLPWGLLWYRRRWLKLVAALLIGPAVFFAGWPWLWVAPAAHLREYLAFHLRHAAYNTWYLGKLYQLAPWHYPFVMTAVTTPTLVLLAAVVGLARCRPRRLMDADQALLLLGLVVSIGPSVLPSSPKYNGVRLFLPAFPFLAALAGGGFAWLQARIAALPPLRRPANARAAAGVALLLGLVLLTPGMRAVVHTHPYQLAYYNALVGGTAGATRRGFETIYWGQVLSEAGGFVNSITKPSPRLLVVPKGVIYLFDFQTVRPDVRFTGDEAEAASADYVLFQCMQSEFSPLCWELYRGARPVFAVRLDGTPLLVAYDRAAVKEALARLARKTALALPASNAAASRDRKSPTRKLAGS